MTLQFTLAVGIPLAMITLGFVVGTLNERRHEHLLDQREAVLAHIIVTDLRTAPPGIEARSGVLVLGESVIAFDYAKQFFAGLRNVVGGEVRSFQSLLSRARREAKVRMLEDAARRGAAAVVNVRFQTSQIGGTEILCSGTALMTTEMPARPVW